MEGKHRNVNGRSKVKQNGGPYSSRSSRSCEVGIIQFSFPPFSFSDLGPLDLCASWCPLFLVEKERKKKSHVGSNPSDVASSRSVQNHCTVNDPPFAVLSSLAVMLSTVLYIILFSFRSIAFDELRMKRKSLAIGGKKNWDMSNDKCGGRGTIKWCISFNGCMRIYLYTLMGTALLIGCRNSCVCIKHSSIGVSIFFTRLSLTNISLDKSEMSDKKRERTVIKIENKKISSLLRRHHDTLRVEHWQVYLVTHK